MHFSTRPPLYTTLSNRQYCRVEKCISLGRLTKFMHGVLSRGPSNQLSSRMSGHKRRTSGHKRCQVDKEYHCPQTHMKHNQPLLPVVCQSSCIWKTPQRLIFSCPFCVISLSFNILFSFVVVRD